MYPRPRKILERHVERKTVSYCKKRGLTTYKFASPSYAGVPDRIIMGHGKILFLELKRPGGKVTPLQQREQDRITDAGHVVGVADTEEKAMAIIDRVFFPGDKDRAIRVISERGFGRVFRQKGATAAYDYV